MKKIIYILALIFLGCLPTFATVQISDKLIYNGKEYKLDKAYLEYFFEKNPDRKPKFEVYSTALWKGYVATFEIENNQLFLTNVEIMGYGEEREIVWQSVLNDIFPDSKKVKVEWFSGILYGGYANNTNYSLEHDNYSLFEIEEGNIIKNKDLNNKEFNKFKAQQFQAFEQTEECQERIKEVKESHAKRNKEMQEHTQGLLDKVKARLEQSELPNETAGMIENNALSKDELKKYAIDLGNTAKSYASAKELSDKEAKEYISYGIFSYTSKFWE